MRAILAGLLVMGFVAVAKLSAGDFKPEPGFTLLFNGKNLDGWKTKKGESLQGKTEAYSGRFKVVGGNLVIDPKVKGDVYIYTTKEFKGDVHIKFDFNPGDACNNDIFFQNNKFDIKKGMKGVKDGEWNQLDIVSSGGKVEFKINGEVHKAAKSKTDGTLGIRAEFGVIQIKNIRAKGV